MKAQCLPFSQIPHSSKLFLDFLSYVPGVRQFYPHSPRFKDWFKQEAAQITYDPARRSAVAAILGRQNRSWGASQKTLENIDRLSRGAAAVVTGQQVGLFGGPLFCILKALTAARFADGATKAGVESVPVFWLATEDHDLAEVSRIAMPGAEGSLQNLAVSSQGIPDAPVGSIAFGPEVETVVEAAAAILGDCEVSTWLREAYRPGETFGSAFAKLLTRLFADYGVILLDASDPELHRIAAPLYRQALERAEELEQALTARGQALDSAGYHQQVKVGGGATLLFGLHNGSRVPLHRLRDAAGKGEEQFGHADQKLPKAELLRRVETRPEDFSPKVLLRPVVQDYLLPTLLYTGGSAEAAYFAQAAVVYEALLGRVTPFVPRFSATVVEQKPQALLERYGLGLTDLFPGPEAVRERIAERAMSRDLQRTFDQAEASLKASLQSVSGALGVLDKTLVDAAGTASEKMQHQLGQLRAKAARAELRQTEVLGRHADLLSTALYPNKALQEREIAGVFYVARQGLELLEILYSAQNPDCLDHQIISL